MGLASTGATTTRAKPEVVEAVCARISAGESVMAIFRTPGRNYPSRVEFWKWIVTDDATRKAYDIALINRGEHYAEEIVAIADDARAPVLDEHGQPRFYTNPETGEQEVLYRITSDSVNHARLKCDTRKWVAARMLPKKYGDRTIIAGDADSPLRIESDHSVISKLLPELAAVGTTKTP